METVIPREFLRSSWVALWWKLLVSGLSALASSFWAIVVNEIYHHFMDDGVEKIWSLSLLIGVQLAPNMKDRIG